jgi:hypothetical protein
MGRGIVVTAIACMVIFHPSSAQKKGFGAGVTVGETVSMGIVPIPVYGGSVIYAFMPSVQAGLQIGFLSGTSSGDSKAFDNVRAIELAPYGKIIMSASKDLHPFFKLSVAWINYNVKLPDEGTDKGEERNESNSSLWGTFGLSYDLSKSVTILGQIRFFDIGMTGDSKISNFGLGAPSVGIEVFF